MAKNLKILIIRFSSIGDIVLTTPVVRCLKQQLSEVEIHYLTKIAFKNILSHNPYIDQIHLLQNSLSDTVASLKSEKFDFVIDLHHNLRTLILKNRLGIKSHSFNKLNWKKWLLVNLHINTLPVIHIVNRYLKTVEFLSVKNDEKGLDYFFTQEYCLGDLLPSTHQKYIGLVIGAQHATKRLPTVKLIEVCKQINQPIILLGGQEDYTRGEEISSIIGNQVFNACGRFTLDQSAYIVKMANAIITHDTGLMHIAAAFNKPIISIWGNTIPEFGMFPYKTNESLILEVKGLTCRPCSKIGYQKCPRIHFKCMNDINVDSIPKFIAEKAQF